MWTKKIHKLDLERAGGGTRDQITNIHWVIKKGKTWKTSASIDYAKAFDYMNLKKTAENC